MPGPPVEAEQLWHDRSRWPSWIDGFGYLEKLDGEWPLEGARRVRKSREGLVAERVVAYRAGHSQTLFIEDERVAGELSVRFDGDAKGTRITVVVDVQPKERMPLGRQWWWKRKRGESLRRTLQRFSYELAGER